VRGGGGCGVLNCLIRYDKDMETAREKPSLFTGKIKPRRRGGITGGGERKQNPSITHIKKLLTPGIIHAEAYPSLEGGKKKQTDNLTEKGRGKESVKGRVKRNGKKGKKRQGKRSSCGT